jgi:hypothetical protein
MVLEIVVWWVVKSSNPCQLCCKKWCHSIFGFITMSSGAWNDWRSLNSMSVRLGGVLGINLGSCFKSCRHCQMNSSRDQYWSSEGDQEDFLALMVSKLASFWGREDWLWNCFQTQSYENGFGICFKWKKSRNPGLATNSLRIG